MTSDKHTATVPDELAGLRLDQALAQMFPDYSRSRLKEWLLSGAIRVEGGPRRPRDAVSGGELVEFEPQPEPEVQVAAEPIELDIVFEDADLQAKFEEAWGHAPPTRVGLTVTEMIEKSDLEAARDILVAYLKTK